ncbi:LysM peptidoglycan-binding domain-containing protein [Aerococcaceae bacterium WGS1372]
MKRKEIIQAKARLKNIQQTKKAIKHLNAGLVLMTAGAVLSHVTVSETVTVQAQSTRLSKSDFLGLITDYAKKIASENDLYASVMIAQAALESGWGNSTLSQAPNYNLFGIKGEYNGNTVVKDTLEDDGTGNYYGIKDGFRKYDNYGQSLTDYASLLTGDDNPNNWRYNFYHGVRVSSTNSYEDATKHLTGRYATDTRYGDKLNRIIAENNLTRYDITSNTGNADISDQEVVEKPANKPVEASSEVYTVQAGDGYWGIARKYGTTVEALKALNGATSNLIHPGQILKLPSTAVIEPNTPNNQTKTSNSNKKPSSQSATYTIQRGDGLFGIARKYGMTLSQLKSLNGLTSDLIHPGQVLKVTGSAEYTTTASDSSNTVNNNNSAVKEGVGTNSTTSSSTYSVKAGEGLYRIAVNQGMTLEQLKSLNGLTSNLIHPGQILKVNTTSQTATSTATTNNAVVEESGSQVVTETAEAETEQTTVTADKVANQEIVVEEQTSSINNTYSVKAGDTLYSIAQRNGLDVYQLVEQNNGSTNIIVGQSINLK